MYAVESDVAEEGSLLIEANSSILLLIDQQTKLAPAVDGFEDCLARSGFLLAAARRLDIPVLATEHCPKQVGPTMATLRNRLEPTEIVEKRYFNSVREPAFEQALDASDRRTVIISGMEAHVCVLQTTLGLMALGYRPVVVADAVASRAAEARLLALDRLRHHGIEIVNAEMVAFEWLEVAGTQAFDDLLPMIKSGSAQ